MGWFLWSSLCISLFSSLLPGSLGKVEVASVPPRGWNSYDSFSWTIFEEEFLQNAELVAHRLHSHGYEYVVVDYLWYRRKVEGAYTNSLRFDVIDEWGRMKPDPGRWPSSRGGKGFTKVAEKVHKMGLKFGIHVMRGISTQAFNANTPILDVYTGKAYEESGRQWRAKDIGMKERTCSWMKRGFMSVDTKLGAGRAFLRSLYQQYAHWGVDFVKHDCVFGLDFNLDEISYVSKVLTELNHPVVYSLSPGTNATPAMARDVSNLVNMYRITADDWDSWKEVAEHFDVSGDFSAANMIGAKGLRGKSWPDLDMLPLGWLAKQDLNEGPHRRCNLSLDEQRTQMTLWSMTKSPLMFGGDMRHLDDKTFSLITNPTLLKINAFSSNNKEMWELTKNGTLTNCYSGLCASTRRVRANSVSKNVRAWIATGRRGKIYVAFFNLDDQKADISMRIGDLAKVLPGRKFGTASCKCREEWSRKDFGVIKDSVSMQVKVHGCVLLVLKCS